MRKTRFNCVYELERELDKIPEYEIVGKIFDKNITAGVYLKSILHRMVEEGKINQFPFSVRELRKELEQRIKSCEASIKYCNEVEERALKSQSKETLSICKKSNEKTKNIVSKAFQILNRYFITEDMLTQA